MNKMSKLNEKQRTFCEEYVIDFNATQAAIRAGYSKKTAYQQGFKLLKKGEIKKLIASLKQKRSQDTNITAKTVLQKLQDILEADLTQIAGMSIDEVKKLPKEVRVLVKSFTITKSTWGDDGEREVIKLVFMDKDKALEN